MLTLTTTKAKSDLSNTDGLNFFRADFDSRLTTNANFTIYFVIKNTIKNKNLAFLSIIHEKTGGINDLTFSTYYSPQEKLNKIRIYFRIIGRRIVNLEKKYENKQIMFWFVKNQNSYKFTYGDRTNVCSYDLVNPHNNSNKAFKFAVNYSMLRVGFAYNAYDIRGVAFNKMMEYEKKKVHISVK